MADPRSVGDRWAEVFSSLPLDEMALLCGEETVAAWIARERIRGGGAILDSQDGEQADQIRVDRAVMAMVAHLRQFGHELADLNPLAPRQTSIDPGGFGLTQEDMDKPVNTDVPMPEGATVGDLVQVLASTYTETTAAEFAHLPTADERRWFAHRLELSRGRAALSDTDKKWVLEHLTAAHHLEQFVHRKFVGAKRFSLEGCDALIPLLHAIIERGADTGVRWMIFGMAHRGRLNVMVNVLKKPLDELFTIFHDEDETTLVGRGDVKYHRGASYQYTTRSGAELDLSLCFNPSHLEFVDPVVLGRARAKQDRYGDTERNQVMPLLLHGDSAVVGQGVVAETCNLHSLAGYQVGGTIHIITNNLIGFTTEPHDYSSMRYSTGLANAFGLPILHVNGEDLDAVMNAAQIAVDYRAQWRKDVFIDLIGYRRHGHNEGDEPRFTQPEMYKAIDAHPPLRDLYAADLKTRGVLTEEEDSAIIERWTKETEAHWAAALDKSEHPEPESLGGAWTGFVGGADSDVPRVSTAVARDTLSELLTAISTPPENINPVRKLRRFFSSRLEMAQGERPLDWGAAEALAFGTLLRDGTTVRLSGQDAERGTFTHRHAVITDPKTYAKWVPLREQARDGALLEIYNSPLSEAAVMGFDWGYSLDRPEALTIWEAQFGDFANAAQVIIDQFLVSAEDKWNRLSGLVLLLPHGYEGQGPEHSSARLERFLHMTAEDNMQVCNLTTPAQIFHVLRRQVIRPYRKPLIIMSPKSLLRHKDATSTLEDLAEGEFQRIIGDVGERSPDGVRRVLLCSGRVYYDLAAERERRGANDVAILRFEQLYPLSNDEIRAALAPYAEKAEFFWVQDEPWNMGAWWFIQARLRESMGRTFPVTALTRTESASPATGSSASHRFEALRLMELSFGEILHDHVGAVTERHV
jgi:2-oxoglutarate dehydrogenase E1 component